MQPAFPLIKDLRKEWPLVISIATTLLFLAYGETWFAGIYSILRLSFLLLWLIVVVSISIFAVVRHADVLAAKLGEPSGTLILTIAVTAIESIVIISTMFAGTGNLGLARDAMLAVIMIVLNGMVGLSLLVGGLRHHEQTYNLQGANAFLALIIPLAVLGLILPTYMDATPGPTLSTLHAVFLIGMSLGLYAIFLAIQNFRHKHYFLSPEERGAKEQETGGHGIASNRSTLYHAAFLIAYFLPVASLSEQLGVPIESVLHLTGAPPVLGGMLVAALVLAPESVGAVRAALANQLQRSVNILLGSVLATVSLTIPFVLTASLIVGKPILLGLEIKDIIVLSLTMIMSVMTFSASRTNVLLGAVHLLIFFAYIMIIFDR